MHMNPFIVSWDVQQKYIVRTTTIKSLKLKSCKRIVTELNILPNILT